MVIPALVYSLGVIVVSLAENVGEQLERLLGVVGEIVQVHEVSLFYMVRVLSVMGIFLMYREYGTRRRPEHVTYLHAYREGTVSNSHVRVNDDSSPANVCIVSLSLDDGVGEGELTCELSHEIREYNAYHGREHVIRDTESLRREGKGGERYSRR